MDEYHKRFPNDEKFRERYTTQSSKFYRDKMMDLVGGKEERLCKLRGYVHDVELPNHLMYHLILEFISAYKQTNQQAKIAINGYACNIGTNEANNTVSQARAKAVGDFMVSNGIPEENIEIKWFGKSMNSMFDYPEMKDYRRVIIGIK